MGSFNNLLLDKQLMTDMIAVAYNYLSTYVRYGSVGTNLISQEKQTKDSRRPPMYLSGGNTRAGCPSWPQPAPIEPPAKTHVRKEHK